MKKNKGYCTEGVKTDHDLAKRKRFHDRVLLYVLIVLMFLSVPSALIFLLYALVHEPTSMHHYAMSLACWAMFGSALVAYKAENFNQKRR